MKGMSNVSLHLRLELLWRQLSGYKCLIGPHDALDNYLHLFIGNGFW